MGWNHFDHLDSSSAFMAHHTHPVNERCFKIHAYMLKPSKLLFVKRSNSCNEAWLNQKAQIAVCVCVGVSLYGVDFRGHHPHKRRCSQVRREFIDGGQGNRWRMFGATPR